MTNLSRKTDSHPPPYSEAARAILDAAEQLAQTRGYNGFSYADIASQLGVTRASLHYHFPSKAELGRALISRYHAVFSASLELLDQCRAKSVERLRGYIGLYDEVLRNDRICLCGMFAAEYTTLPLSMQQGLKVFFDMNERWLTDVLLEGRRAGSFSFTESPRERARVILGALEGAMLIARSYGDPRRFKSAAGHLVADLVAGGRPFPAPA